MLSLRAGWRWRTIAEPAAADRPWGNPLVGRPALWRQRESSTGCGYRSRGAEVGFRAPDFALQTLGVKPCAVDLIGRPVVISYWTTVYSPAELPSADPARISVRSHRRDRQRHRPGHRAGVRRGR
jgi:hypothetical protein